MIRSALIVALLVGVVSDATAATTVPSPSDADSLAMDWSRVPEYRLVPGDEMILNFGLPVDITNESTRPQRIRPDGRISVFPVGDIVAAGRTVRELEGELVRLLAGELRRPRVTVEVTEVAGNEVHVLGRVGRPGSYKAGPYLTVSQAIAAAGGLTDDASPNNLLVFHRDGARTVKVMRLRLGDAISRGRLEADIPLGRFDIVYVPRSRIGDINLFVKNFFTNNLGALQFAILGWELFHIEQVYFVPGNR